MRAREMVGRMSLDQILNLFALVIVNACGFAALAPRLKRVEDKLDGKLDAKPHAEVHDIVNERLGHLEDTAA